MSSCPCDLIDLICNSCSDPGRGIPDIAAQARGFPVFLSGQEKNLYGTGGSATVRPPPTVWLEHPTDHQYTDRGGHNLAA